MPSKTSALDSIRLRSRRSVVVARMIQDVIILATQQNDTVNVKVYIDSMHCLPPI
jgi:hypothetical protein